MGLKASVLKNSTQSSYFLVSTFTSHYVVDIDIGLLGLQSVLPYDESILSRMLPFNLGDGVAVIILEKKTIFYNE